MGGATRLLADRILLRRPLSTAHFVAWPRASRTTVSKDVASSAASTRSCSWIRAGRPRRFSHDGHPPEVNADVGAMLWSRGLPAVAVTAAAAGFGYWVLYGQAFNMGPKSFDLNPMAEDIFEWADDLFVFALDEPSELVGRQEVIQRVLRTLASEASLHHLRYFYNMRKEGDPPMPEQHEKNMETADGEVAGVEATAGTAAEEAPLRVMMYKGQRRAVLELNAAMPSEQVQEVVSFFSPVSEDLKEAARKLEVPRVSGKTFHSDVVAESSPTAPILLQMYEDTCFLCFLMRPFINELSKHLRENNIPLQIKRLNLEKNDFPPGCPVARGTPTFVLFRGGGVAPVKWDEFKPNDIVEKIRSEFPQCTEQVYAQMDELQRLVSSRLQLFMQTVMWTVELQKLGRLRTSATVRTQPNQSGEAPERPDADPTEDVAFSSVVSDMMLRDMRRTDGIRENLKHLQKELEELEHDAALTGSMFAQSVLDREREEANRK